MTHPDLQASGAPIRVWRTQSGNWMIAIRWFGVWHEWMWGKRGPEGL